MIYLYVMACPDKTNFNIGYSIDITNAMEFYRGLPSLDKTKLPVLVYLEGYIDKGAAADRFKYFSALNTDEKISVIETVNPEFIELIPGVNIDV